MTDQSGRRPSPVGGRSTRQTLAAGICQAMAVAGFSEADVAVRMETGSSTVYRWARGLAVPRPATFERMCSVLGADPTEVRSGYNVTAPK